MPILKSNLHKAQKYITKLNQEVKSFSINSVGVLTIDLGDNTEYIINSMKTKIKEDKEDFEKNEILSKDLNKIKSTIFKKNIENGTHELLVDLNLNRKALGTYKSLISNIKRTNDIKKEENVTEEFIETKKQVLSNSGNSYQTRINYSIFDVEDLEKKSKELSKEIEKLEDKLAYNNINSIIEVDISEETMAFLNFD
jgi:hypothetical protein